MSADNGENKNRYTCTGCMRKSIHDNTQCAGWGQGGGLAKNKDVRVACAGCFKRDMRITDTTRCKKRARFVKHWDCVCVC